MYTDVPITATGPSKRLQTGCFNNHRVRISGIHVEQYGLRTIFFLRFYTKRDGFRLNIRVCTVSGLWRSPGMWYFWRFFHRKIFALNCFLVAKRNVSSTIGRRTTPPPHTHRYVSFPFISDKGPFFLFNPYSPYHHLSSIRPSRRIRRRAKEFSF